MHSQKLLWLIGAVCFIVPLLGCDTQMLGSTSATSTDTTIITTTVATPILAGNASTLVPAIIQPKPDTLLTGILEKGASRTDGADDVGTIESGMINLLISDDGTHIASINFDLTTVRCRNVTSGNMSLSFENFNPPISIVDGKIVGSYFESREIKGQFSAPTEAKRYD